MPRSCRSYPRSLRHLASAVVAAAAAAAAPAAPAAQELRGQPFTQEAIDALVREEALDHGVPGVGVAIVARGKVLCCCGYGVADVRNSSPVTAATAFNIASLSKPFTALVVLQLIEQGAFDLDTTARSLLSWLPESAAEITVEQLLTHTSGIVRDVRHDNADDPIEAEYCDRIARADRSFAAGARFEYSNSGFALLGFLAEAATKAPLGELLRRQLFDPAGMDQSSYRAPVGLSTRAQPHAVVEGAAVPCAYVSGGFGSGGIASSTADLANFAMVLQGSGALTGVDIDSAFVPGRLASGEEARCSVLTADDRYGFGWFLSSLNGRRLATHGGAINGFSANLYHFPDEQLTIALVANCKQRADGQVPVDPLCRRIASYCLDEGRAAAAAESPIARLRAELATAADQLSAAVRAGEPRALSVAGLPADRDRTWYRSYFERITRNGDAVTAQSTWYERRVDGSRELARTGRCVDRWHLRGGAWLLIERVPELAPERGEPLSEGSAPGGAATAAAETADTPDPADSPDSLAVRAAVEDYVEGIYTADVARVARCVHPTLAKRGFWRERGQGDYIDEPMTYAQLLETAATWNKERRSMAHAARTITVFDVLDQIATARLVAHWGVDYLQLARIDGRWQIVNVLWQSPPPTR